MNAFGKFVARIVIANALALVDLAVLWYFVEKQGFRFEWAFAFMVFLGISWSYVGIISGDKIE